MLALLAVIACCLLTCCAENKLGGGSHIAKINGVVEFLDSMDPSTDDDLVFMLDAYGTHPNMIVSVVANPDFC